VALSTHQPTAHAKNATAAKNPVALQLIVAPRAAPQMIAGSAKRRSKRSSRSNFEA
jgi:hypothetical protein